MSLSAGREHLSPALTVSTASSKSRHVKTVLSCKKLSSASHGDQNCSISHFNVVSSIVWHWRALAVLLPQTSPAVAPALPLALPPAAAPTPAAPSCPGGLPGAWQCGAGNSSLLFDEATHQELLSTYPGQCTALTADALLCGSVLLTADAQSALSAGACTFARWTYPPALPLHVLASAPFQTFTWHPEIRYLGP